MERTAARMPAVQVRGRFAPTPSGRMHLGNVFCALAAWLSARAQGGRLVLRIEDLDAQRCPVEYAHQIGEDLAWFGLDWDEGGTDELRYPEYFQSRRSAAYVAALDRLQQQGLLYPCFCSRGELHAADAPHLSDGTYRYSGKCRGLTEEQVLRLQQRRNPAVRIRVPDRTIGFRDLNYGYREENLERDCGDFILRRSDGVYAYQLAVVVDDGSMGVTEVVRGRDLLSSAPRQIYLFERLGLEPPAFGHIPLLLAPDGTRLSKRDRALDLGRLRQNHTPEELLGILAAGCGLLDAPEPVCAGDLVPLFSWDRIGTRDIRLPAVLWDE